MTAKWVEIDGDGFLDISLTIICVVIGKIHVFSHTKLSSY
jgi:hypothetical protein